jgi:hypothetical protein
MIADQESLRHAVPPDWSYAANYTSTSVLGTLGFEVIIPISKRSSKGLLATCIGATKESDVEFPGRSLTEPQSTLHHLDMLPTATNHTNTSNCRLPLMYPEE